MRSVIRTGLVASTTLVLLSTNGLRADDAGASEAAGKLLAAKTLATVKAPAEQWLASYAGGCWTQAVKLTVVEKDGDLRRYEIERLETREKELPQREHDRWWFDQNGALVKGDRKSFEAGHEPAEIDLRYHVKNGKISVRQADNPQSETAELPKEGNFLPDKLLALLVVPDEKGKTWRFSTLGGENEFLPFTVEDMGKEKVATRTGSVEARKLRVKEPGGEALYWVDADRKIVAARWPSLENLLAVTGTEDESRTDWWARPTDEADAASDKLVKAGAAIDKQPGALSFAVYGESGELKATANAKLAKEEKDGKAVFQYRASIAEASSGTLSTEEWTFGQDGKLLAGKYSVKGGKVDAVDCKLRVEGDKMISTISDAPDGKEELPFTIPPRMVADSYFLMKPCAAAGPGSYRFYGFDLAGRYVYSIYITVKGEEEITLLSGIKAKARRLTLTQNVAEADVWLDAKGELLLISWKDGDLNVFGPTDKMPEKLPSHIGPDEKGTKGHGEKE